MDAGLNVARIIGHVAGLQGVDLLGARGTASQVGASDRALFAKDGGAAGDALEIGDVADQDTGNICESLHGFTSI